MKKIGILFGQEDTFPWAFIDRVNSKKIKGVVAEAVIVDMVQQAAPTDYAVIIDRISQDVPFYRAYLKNAAIAGTAVINNPFWWSADEKFFNNALAETIGVPVPKTVILPSNHRPDDTDERSFRNMAMPISWDNIFDYIGFPAYMKPHSGGGWKSVYKVSDPNDLFAKHSETEQLVMMLQEEIEFKEYFRCYALGGDRIHIMQYEPRNPFHERYLKDAPPVDKKLLNTVKDYCLKLNRALGYDFNTVEFAVRDGIPYAIDFCNPAPDADINSVGQVNFDWIVENAAEMAIEKAQNHKDGQMNLTWGTFIKNQFTGSTASTPAKEVKAKKTTPLKRATPKSSAKVAAKPTVKNTVKKAAKTAAKVATKPTAKKTAKPSSKKAAVKSSSKKKAK